MKRNLKMPEIIKKKKILNAVAKKYSLQFDKKHGYYTGNTYTNGKGECLSRFEDHIDIGDRYVYQLKYFDGCFNPFLVRKEVNDA
jgi:hypothetical protein